MESKDDYIKILEEALRLSVLYHASDNQPSHYKEICR